MSATFSQDIDVRWGELDSYQHVNNAVYLRYFEEARIRWFQGLGEGWQSAIHGPVVVNVNCNYRREIVYPCALTVHMRAVQASEKRLQQHYLLHQRDDPNLIYADAEVTVVWIDRRRGQSIPLPEVVRQALHKEN